MPYVMAYTALGPRGPHVALASSRDLTRCPWEPHEKHMGIP
jgi:hypothetical protein